MTQREFLLILEELCQVTERSVILNLEHLPKGSEPGEGGHRRHHWYARLASGDQARVNEVVRVAVHMAMFEFLVLLDGPSGYPDRSTGMFELRFLKDESVSILNDRNEDFLHGQFTEWTEPLEH